MAFDLFPRTYRGRNRCVLRQKHALINSREPLLKIDINLKQSSQSDWTVPSTQPQSAQPVPPAQPYQAVQQYAGQYGAAQPGAVFPPQAVQPPVQPSRPGESAGKGKKKTALIVGIIIAVLVVALAAGFGVWWFMLRDSGTQSVVPEKLRTLDRGRPWRDSQFASTRLSPSRDMSR